MQTILLHRNLTVSQACTNPDILSARTMSSFNSADATEPINNLGEVVTMAKMIKNWSPEFVELWDQQTLKLRHSLHELPLFSDERLAQQIENYPREFYNLHTMDHKSHNIESWREGEFGQASGKDIIQSIKDGRIWLNMRNISEVSTEYQDMLNDIFSDFESSIPELKTYRRTMGLLISSPKAQCYYHFDVPGQMLWQIRGSKRVYVYAPKKPFLSQKDQEDVVLNRMDDVKIRYEDWFDNYSDVIEISPGDALVWPLNSPHRVENLDCMNISLTIEYYTDEIRNKYAMNYANGLLRSGMRLQHPSQAITGSAFYGKLAMAAFHKYSGMQKRLADKRVIDFQIDPDAENKIRSIPAKDFSARCAKGVDGFGTKIKDIISNLIPRQKAAR